MEDVEQYLNSPERCNYLSKGERLIGLKNEKVAILEMEVNQLSKVD